MSARQSLDTPIKLTEELCNRAGLSTEETEDMRERMYFASLQMCLDLVAPGEGPPEQEKLEGACLAAGEFSVGGSDGEPPRESGSKYSRPEGLSAGARYLRGGA